MSEAASFADEFVLMRRDEQNRFRRDDGPHELTEEDYEAKEYRGAKSDARDLISNFCH